MVRATLVAIGTLLAVAVALPHTATAELMLVGDADTLTTRDGSFAQYTFGNKFTVGVNPLKVTALGYADRANGDGLANSHQVGIWTGNGSTLLTSLTVPSGSIATLMNDFRWVELGTPLVLAANSTYVIGGDTGPGTTAADTYRWGFPGAGQLGPGFAITGRYQTDPPGASFGFPRTHFVSGEVWASVNMEYQVVPEPSIWILLGSGTIGLLCYRRRRM